MQTKLNNLLPDLKGTNTTTAQELALILKFANETNDLYISFNQLLLEED